MDVALNTALARARGLTRARRLAARLGLSVATVLTTVAISAPAASADVGYQGLSYSGTGSPTGTKRAESVLWWNDGSWWGHMWHRASGTFHIFRLDAPTQQWIDTGVVVETRANTHSDVLWDGIRLYVASHEFVGENGPAVPGSPSYLFRLTYDPFLKTYHADPGFPVAINDYKTETLVIDKDSRGKLWATWQQDNRIYVNRTVGDDLAWGTPFVLPTAGTTVAADDISAVIAFGDRIGVMWSNQLSASVGMWFAVHVDGQPDDVWEASRTAIQGSGTSDDHISLKSVQADGSGRVYAGIKTGHSSAAAPLFMLLVRDPVTGDWSSHTVARVADCPTRPMIVIDEENRVIHAYATYPGPPDYTCSERGAIYEKTSPLDSISFAEGAGTPVIEDSDLPWINNVSSTKQVVSSTTGIALLAVNTSTLRYWHNLLPISPVPPADPPTADFSATPTSGVGPLAVSFSDLSTGAPTSWTWVFGDGATSADRNPQHTYTSPGLYTVSLTVGNANGTNTATKTGYITVIAPPDFALSATPASRAIVAGATTTYAVTVTPSGGFSGEVELSVTGLPAGATAGFSANPVTVGEPAVATLTVTTTTRTKPGSRVLTIIGRSGSLSRSTTVSLQVKKK